MPTIEAQDIVNAVIQDSQSQTTNRTALYDYTDRIHQRILRESQWRFLLSDPETFITLPGVSGYTLVDGTAPAGAFQTNLMIANFQNLAPDSVFDVSNWRKLSEDSDSVTSFSATTNRDGSLRYGPPRTYSNSIANSGTIYLKPVPDGENNYYPVPETPYVTYAAQSGCTLGNRMYYGVVTYVDSLGGESTQCVIPFVISVPAGCVATVTSPGPVPGGNIASNQALYGAWNLYIGFSLNNYLLQNPTPIQLGTPWVEPIQGAFVGALPVPSIQNTPWNTQLSILSTGQLSSTFDATMNPAFPYAFVDTDGNWWEVISDPITHMIETTSIAPSPASIKGFTSILLTDTSNISTWQISVNTSGQLESTVISSPPTVVYGAQNPPQSTTIQPLNGYVIQFRYYMSRNQIVNPTDILQIPYAYKDIVIAGVNYLANLYVDQRTAGTLSDRTMEWKRVFEAGMSQIRRDLRINYRKTDYISPDVATQYTVGNLQGIPTMGW